MNEMKNQEKSNKIVVIPLYFPNSTPTATASIHIPFAVKKIKIVNFMWFFLDSKMYDGVIDDKVSPEVQDIIPRLSSRVGYGYLNSNIQDMDMIGLLDSYPTQIPVKYIYGTPINVQGTYTFSISDIEKKPLNDLKAVYVLLTLEFLQE